MRKKRTRALTLFLAVGLTAGLYTAPGAKVYAEEENGQQVVAVEETIPDDDSTPGGASEEGSNGISEEQLTEERKFPDHPFCRFSFPLVRHGRVMLSGRIHIRMAQNIGH